MALTNGVHKGKGLSLTINSVEYNLDANSIVMSSEDKEDLVFADLNANGGKQWFFTVSAFQDTATGSLWRYVWDNAGSTGVAFTFKPYGNSTATPTKPHFTGTLTVPAKPDFGGVGNEGFKFEARFDISGVPTMATA